MQKLLMILATSFIVTSSYASTMVFTATRVLQVSDRQSPAQRLLKTPVRVDSDQKTVLLPRFTGCASGACSEVIQYTSLKLVKFQKIAGNVTMAKATGQVNLENGVNSAVVEISGNNNQTGRLMITTVSPDGRYKSQAMLEGYFTESVF